MTAHVRRHCRRIGDDGVRREVRQVLENGEDRVPLLVLAEAALADDPDGHAGQGGGDGSEDVARREVGVRDQGPALPKDARDAAEEAPGGRQVGNGIARVPAQPPVFENVHGDAEAMEVLRERASAEDADHARDEPPAVDPGGEVEDVLLGPASLEVRKDKVIELPDNAIPIRLEPVIEPTGLVNPAPSSERFVLYYLEKER